MDDHVPGDAWPDQRLDAAFAAMVPGTAPRSLEASVAARLEERPSRRWLAVPGLAASGLAVVVIAAIAGPALLAGIAGPLAGTVTVRDGEPGTKVLDAGEFSFAFPAGWSAADSGASFSGGSSIAVLGTLPVDPRCGTDHVDVNCAWEQRLEPGTVRAWVHTSSYRTGSILDEPAVDGSWTDLTIDGMPARLEERTIAPDDFYRSDLDLTLLVARPGGFGHVVTIELRAREPGTESARAAMDMIIATFRFMDPLPTLPPDDAAGEDVARRVLAESDEVLRVSIGQGSGATPYSCQADEPGIVAEAEIGYDFDSALGGAFPARCSWMVERRGDRFWLVTVRAGWDVGAHANEGTETIWVDATGAVMGRRTEHLSATPTAPPQDAPPAGELPVVDAVLGLPVMTVEAALEVVAGQPGDRELAVLGWWPGDPRVECPAPADAGSSPAVPRCPDQFRFLTADREALIEVAPDSLSGHPPSGPALTLHFRDGAQPPPNAFPANGVVEPVPLLVLGHVADHRAALCPQELRDECESAFIVDLVLVPGDPAFPTRLDDRWSGGAELEPAASEDLVIELARWAARSSETGTGPFPVVGIMRLSPGALTGVEPGMGAPGLGIGPGAVTWIVKLLVPDGEGHRIETIAMPDVAYADLGAALDAGFDVYRLTRDGVLRSLVIN